MQLVSCQSCGHQVAAAVKFCPECGQRRDLPVLSRESLSGALPIQARRTESTRPRCPGCAGEQFRKLSLIYAAGVSHVSTTTGGVGLSLGGAIGLGRAVTEGSHVTELARQAAPPEPMSVTLMAGVTALVGLLLGLGFGSVWAGLVLVVPVLFGGATAYWVMKYNREVFVPAYSRWERTFMCERCGEIFTL